MSEKQNEIIPEGFEEFDGMLVSKCIEDYYCEIGRSDEIIKKIIIRKAKSLEAELEPFKKLLTLANDYYGYNHSGQFLKDMKRGVRRCLPQIDVIKDGFCYHIVVHTVKRNV